jgi:hypothetical protein
VETVYSSVVLRVTSFGLDLEVEATTSLVVEGTIVMEAREMVVEETGGKAMDVGGEEEHGDEEQKEHNHVHEKVSWT